jgi:DNA-binding NarL/FixJ family response regulator
LRLLGPRGQKADVSEQGHIRIVVIDDDPDICEVLRVVAEHHADLEWVGSYPTPEDAVTICRTDPPDAILRDHYFTSAEPAEALPAVAPRGPMRGLSGLEAVEYLRAVAPSAVIAVYTGAAGLGESVEHSGADLYVLKGGEPRAVLDEVAQHVRRRRG